MVRRRHCVAIVRERASNDLESEASARTETTSRSRQPSPTAARDVRKMEQLVQPLLLLRASFFLLPPPALLPPPPADLTPVKGSRMAVAVSARAATRADAKFAPAPSGHLQNREFD